MKEIIVEKGEHKATVQLDEKPIENLEKLYGIDVVKEIEEILAKELEEVIKKKATSPIPQPLYDGWLKWFRKQFEDKFEFVMDGDIEYYVEILKVKRKAETETDLEIITYDEWFANKHKLIWTDPETNQLTFG